MGGAKQLKFSLAGNTEAIAAAPEKEGAVYSLLPVVRRDSVQLCRGGAQSRRGLDFFFFFFLKRLSLSVWATFPLT